MEMANILVYYEKATITAGRLYSTGPRVPFETTLALPANIRIGWK